MGQIPTSRACRYSSCWSNFSFTISYKNVWMYYLNGLLLYLPNNMQFPKIHNLWIRGTKRFLSQYLKIDDIETGGWCTWNSLDPNLISMCPLSTNPTLVNNQNSWNPKQLCTWWKKKTAFLNGCCFYRGGKMESRISSTWDTLGRWSGGGWGVLAPCNLSESLKCKP